MRGEAGLGTTYRALKSRNKSRLVEPTQSRCVSHNSIRSSQTRIDSCSEPMSRPGQPSPHKRILQAVTRLAHVPAVFLQLPLNPSHVQDVRPKWYLLSKYTRITRQPLCPGPNGSIPSSQAISNLLPACVSRTCRMGSTRSRSHRLCQPWLRKHGYSRPVQSTDSYKRRARSRKQLTKREESV